MCNVDNFNGTHSLHYVDETAVYNNREDSQCLGLLSIVIPARDEEGCIASTVQHLHLELRLQGVPHEIVVVDDGSSDRTWEIPDDSLDVVFTSNFFEHLPNKSSLAKTLQQACRCLRSGGRIICLGPNIRYLPGLYWDFWDHFVQLTDLSLAEGLELNGFNITQRVARFLPYTMSDKRPPVNFLIRVYLSMPFIWWLKGRQFLVVGTKP